jgi:hypothetical protein
LNWLNYLLGLTAGEDDTEKPDASAAAVANLRVNDNDALAAICLR